MASGVRPNNRMEPTVKSDPPFARGRAKAAPLLPAAHPWRYASTLALCIVLAISSVTASANEDPKVLMYERNPWRMAIGSDSPVFAAYDTGVVIYLVSGSQQAEYRQTKLDQLDYKMLLEKVRSLSSLDSYYELSQWTDGPTTEIVFDDGNTLRTISVYGFADGKSKQAPPPGFSNVYEYLRHFNPDNSVAWTPKFIEVVVWPYEHASDESIQWPKEWPDLNTPATRHLHDEMYSIYLPYHLKSDLVSLLSTQREKGAVLINDRKWTVTTRIPFPHETPAE